MDSILALIGSNLRSLRKSASLSQEKLAEKTGLHRTYIGAVERGEKNISARNIAKIAEAFGVNAYVLLHPKMIQHDPKYQIHDRNA